MLIHCMNLNPFIVSSEKKKKVILRMGWGGFARILFLKAFNCDSFPI